MSNTGTKVVKNASALMLSQLITWSLTLLLTIFLPRYLGPEQAGQYTLAWSIWVIGGVLISFGMDTLLTKEIARNPLKTSALLSTTIAARMLLYMLTCGLVALYLYWTKASTTTITLVCIVGITQLFTQLYTAFQSTLQGLELMGYVSIADVVNKAFYCILGVAVLLLGYGVYGIAILSAVAVVISFLMLVVFLSRHHRLGLQFDPHQIRLILRSGLPYLVSGIGLVAYGQVDILVISSLVNTTEVGWYSAASRLFGSVMFIPVIFTTAVFPTLTRTYSSSPDSLPRIMRKSYDLLLVLSVPIGLGIMVISNPVVVLLFGSQFAQSGPILAVMGLVVIFTYQNILLGRFLTSTDRQNAWTIVILIATVVTVPLDILLVPWCEQMFGNGAIGGSLSFLITEIGMVVAGIRLLPPGSLGWSNVRVAAQVTIAGLAMAGVSWWLRDSFVAIPIIVGALSYTVLILLLRVVPREDLDIFKQFAQSALQRVRQRASDAVTMKGV